MAVSGGEKSAIINCTVAGNKGPGGGGISSKAKNSVYNTVVWNNTQPQMLSDFGADDVQYSAVDKEPYGQAGKRLPSLTGST